MTLNGALREASERACASIAPTWPLDRFIAVNPFWARTNKPFPHVAGELASLSGARLLMSRSWFNRELRAGRLRKEHLRHAIAESKASVSEDHLSGLLRIEEPKLTRRPIVVDIMDSRSKSDLEVSWRDYVVERISRFCTTFFDDGQAQIKPPQEEGLYAAWRFQAQDDRGPSLFMGLSAYRSTAASLPATAEEMIALAISDLKIPVSEQEAYLSALLLDINGWASWCAYLRWTARLEGRDDDRIRELLAVRAAWEWILYRAGTEDLRIDWEHAVASWPTFDRIAQSTRAEDWLVQRAAEMAFHSELAARLPEGFANARPTAPSVQAAFCLDVRSEIFRRALEAQSEGVQTIGCAGFFGIPVEYTPLAADHSRPQLPGLLAPKYRVTDEGASETLKATRTARLLASDAWKAFKSSSLSSFAFVDAMGLFYAGTLFNETFRRGDRHVDAHAHAGLTAAENKERFPRITSRVDGAPLAIEERVGLAEGILKGMGLLRGFAPIVLLAGHGAGSRNNAHAAGLDCGACCGHKGDVNARAAAGLLNDPEVRAGLAARGIEIPTSTRFVGGLHNTTTDEFTLFDNATTSATHARELEELRGLLERAGVAARRERAPKLGLAALSDEDLRRAVVERTKNWAEVRPEWGLAGNAAFVIAPRERTKHLDLQGRVFLHDYRCEEDSDDATVLEQIMTGPMVVAHWINLQYYASTVDNTRYGCGNKVLHNIVGGHLGVYEGNGGDLRIGLSIQSLHDGERWMHAPLRLGVFIEASRDAIDRVLAKHAKVCELVDNEWLHLFQLDGRSRSVAVRRKTGWASAL